MQYWSLFRAFFFQRMNEESVQLRVAKLVKCEFCFSFGFELNYSFRQGFSASASVKELASLGFTCKFPPSPLSVFPTFSLPHQSLRSKANETKFNVTSATTRSRIINLALISTTTLTGFWFFNLGSTSATHLWISSKEVAVLDGPVRQHL